MKAPLAEQRQTPAALLRLSAYVLADLSNALTAGLHLFLCSVAGEKCDSHFDDDDNDDNNDDDNDDDIDDTKNLSAA